MNDEHQIIKDEIEVAVNKAVNEKFDPASPTYVLVGIETRLARIEEIMKEMRPVIDMYKASKVWGIFMKWLASVGVAGTILWKIIHFK